MGKDKTDSYGFPNEPENTNVSEGDIPRKSHVSVKGILLGCFIVFYIISVILSGYLAWHCYAVDLKLVRVFKTVLACIFSYLFLAYFFVLRVLLKVPCY